MSEKEISEGNQLILLFNELKIKTINCRITIDGQNADSSYDVYTRGDTRCEEEYISTLFPFHKSFSLLMTVVDKIKSLGFTVIIQQSKTMNTCKIHGDDEDVYLVNRSSHIAPLIEVVWDSVVKFIKYENAVNWASEEKKK